MDLEITRQEWEVTVTRDAGDRWADVPSPSGPGALRPGKVTLLFTTRPGAGEVITGSPVIVSGRQVSSAGVLGAPGHLHFSGSRPGEWPAWLAPVIDAARPQPPSDGKPARQAAGRVLLAELAALPGCAAIGDPGHVPDRLWSGDRPPGDFAPVLGEDEVWDVGAVRRDFNVRLAQLLYEDEGIEWEPGAPAAVIPPGMTPASAASRWQHALDRMERFLDMITATAAKGRPPADGVRSPDVPGAAWVTAARPDGPAGAP